MLTNNVCAVILVHSHQHVFIFIYLFSTSFIPREKFGSPQLGMATEAARVAIPISNGAGSIFRVSRQSYGCYCL